MNSKKLRREIIFDTFLYLYSFISIVFLFNYNYLVTILLVASLFIAIRFWKNREDVYLFLIAAIVGPLSEIIAINFGVWRYSNPSFLGIPIWLPFAWGYSMVFIKRVTEIIIKTRK